MTTRFAYKLLRLRKDGSLGPLFINRRMRVPVGEWLSAENHPTKGYAVRQGWHATTAPGGAALEHSGPGVGTRRGRGLYGACAANDAGRRVATRAGMTTPNAGVTGAELAKRPR